MQHRPARRHRPGRHDPRASISINIAQFALGRNGDRAIGVVIVDEPTPIPDVVLDELRQQKAIREVRLVQGSLIPIQLA